jgi:hypothetical protein
MQLGEGAFRLGTRFSDYRCIAVSDAGRIHGYRFVPVIHITHDPHSTRRGSAPAPLASAQR